MHNNKKNNNKEKFLGSDSTKDQNFLSTIREGKLVSHCCSAKKGVILKWDLKIENQLYIVTMLYFT